MCVCSGAGAPWSVCAGSATLARMGPILRLLREPVLHFLVLGALLVALRMASSGPERIELDEAVDRALAEEHAARHGTPPTDEELAAARRRWLEEEALYREARVLGLDEGDAIVRRRLIQKMELVLTASIPPPAIDDAAREAFLTAHEVELSLPERRTLRLRFFAGTRADAEADARAARLVEAAADPWLRADGLGAVSRGEAERALGPTLAAAAFALEVGETSEPVAIDGGFAVVTVERIEPARRPTLERVASRIDAAITAEAREAALRDAIEEVTARWAR